MMGKLFNVSLSEILFVHELSKRVKQLIPKK